MDADAARPLRDRLVSAVSDIPDELAEFIAHVAYEAVRAADRAVGYPLPAWDRLNELDQRACMERAKRYGGEKYPEAASMRDMIFRSVVLTMLARTGEGMRVKRTPPENDNANVIRLPLKEIP